MRLLFDPSPEASGGGTATPTPTPTATPTPTPTPTATAAAPQQVTVTAEEYRRFLEGQTRLAEIEAQRQRDLEEKEAARLKALAEKGEVERALTELRTAKDNEVRDAKARAEALEGQILGDRKDAVITAALLGTSFVGDEAAAQAREILGSRFEAVRDAAGVVTVREKGTGRPAAEAIKEWLASKSAAHFLKATSTGGAGSSGANAATPTPKEGEQTAAPLPWDQNAVQVLKARQSAATGHYGLTKPAPSRN